MNNFEIKAMQNSAELENMAYNKANISEFFTPVVSKNLLDQRQSIVGDMNAGVVTANSASLYVYTPLMGVIPGRTVYSSWKNKAGTTGNKAIFRAHKYDANKAYIGYDSVSWAISYTIPSGTYYIRFQYPASDWDNVYATYQVEYDKMTTVEKYSNYSLSPAVNITRSEGNPNIINCFGDSLTEGAGSTATHDFPAVLPTLLGGGFTVRNLGIGGESSKAVTMRQGGIPLYVNPFTIPATTTAVLCTLPQTLGYDVDILKHAGAVVDANYAKLAINPVTIAGIQGTLSRPDVGNNDYYFTRLVAGSEVVLTRPTFVNTYANANYRSDIAVIWEGTNDTSLTTEQIMQIQQYTVDNLKHNKYIIVGLTAKNLFADIATRNTAMMQKWGKHFLDIRTYILSYGLADANITPTTQDDTDISNGEIPTSLRSDATHLNDAGYSVVANQIYKKGVDLGYWS